MNEAEENRIDLLLDTFNARYLQMFRDFESEVLVPEQKDPSEGRMEELKIRKIEAVRDILVVTVRCPYCGYEETWTKNSLFSFRDVCYCCNKKYQIPKRVYDELRRCETCGNNKETGCEFWFKCYGDYWKGKGEEK